MNPYSMKKISAIITALSAGAVLSGCTFGASIDTLMSPPKLSVEQEEIYTALTTAQGTAISLKYPKSGKYLSAFIIEDIDGDGGNEAIVFYERNNHAADENPLRINILDKDGGKWNSVYDRAAEGSEVERVMISKLGASDRINLIIGTSMINRAEKNVTIYNYSDRILQDADFSKSYSFTDITDLDMDGENELLRLGGDDESDTEVIEIYTIDDEGRYHKLSNELGGSYADFDVSYGKLGSGLTGVYIDAVSGTNSIQSDVFYVGESNEKHEKALKKVSGNPEEAVDAIRPAGCTSFDVDGDGQLEIPVQTLAPGYTDIPAGEQLWLTEWDKVNEDYTLEQRYTSYYSINDGYIFIFPEKWIGKVTVKRDTVNDEIVFCSYTIDEDKNMVMGRELLHIFCAEDLASREDRLAGGYMLMHTKGDSAYLAFIPQNIDTEGDGLSITAGDAAVGFRYRD